MTAEKVKRFLKEMRAVKGAHYEWHFVRRGDTGLPSAAPMYVRGKYSAAYVKDQGVNCTGLGNQALGRMGLPAPEVRGNEWWTGGTPEWFDALKNMRRITEQEMERGFPVGTALISDYVDDEHQGHIVWVTTPKKNGKQLTIGSDAAGPGPNKPGVTEQRTVRDAVSTFGLTHAGETPGIGVISGDGAEADDGKNGKDGGGDGKQDEGAAGGFDVVDLREAMPGLPLQKARDYLPHLVAAMREAGIITRVRACHFLAQLGHESADLRHMQELGDTAYFTRLYEGRRDLGNTQRGDGARYHGRGPIQLTGRHNYREAGEDLGLDLERNPEKAADPDVAFRIAGWYWTTRNLNKFADEGDAGVDDVTRLINGGFNGLADRKARYFNCKRVLPERFSVGKGKGKTDGGGGEGEDMAFEKVILGHVGHADGELAHLAAAILHRHDVKCTVADAGNIKAAIAACESEEVGVYDFLVIGEAARDVFPDRLKKYIGETVRRSDYRDAVGEDPEETAGKLARVLDGLAQRKDIPGDLRGEFEEALELVELDRPAADDRGRGKHDESGDGWTRENGKKVRDRRRHEGARASSGNGDGRDDKREAGELDPDDLTEEDLEVIGKEALEFYSAIRKLRG